MKPCYWSVFRFLRKGNLVRLDSTALSNSECLPSNTWSTQPYKGSKKIATLLRTAVVNKHTRYATFECTNTLQHCSKHSVLNASGQPFARHWMVMACWANKSRQLRTLMKWNQLSFQEIFDHVPKLPKSMAKTKKNDDAWCSEDGDLKYYLPLCKISWRAKDKTESTSINIC